MLWHLLADVLSGCVPLMLVALDSHAPVRREISFARTCAPLDPVLVLASQLGLHRRPVHRCGHIQTTTRVARTLSSEHRCARQWVTQRYFLSFELCNPGRETSDAARAYTQGARQYKAAGELLAEHPEVIIIGGVIIIVATNPELIPVAVGAGLGGRCPVPAFGF